MMVGRTMRTGPFCSSVSRAASASRDPRRGSITAVARDAIYGHPPSPYRALLRLAGCQWGEPERLVRREALPARFGGGPTNYQLVEEARADGHPSLRLLVHARSRREPAP